MASNYETREYSALVKETPKYSGIRTASFVGKKIPKDWHVYAQENVTKNLQTKGITTHKHSPSKLYLRE
jgi:hypothetical protein